MALSAKPFLDEVPEDPHWREAAWHPLKVLNQRGGVSPKEMAAVLLNKSYRETMDMTEADAVEIIIDAMVLFPGKPP